MLDNLESADTLSYSYGFIVLILIFFISKIQICKTSCRLLKVQIPKRECRFVIFA